MGFCFLLGCHSFPSVDVFSARKGLSTAALVCQLEPPICLDVALTHAPPLTVRKAPVTIESPAGEGELRRVDSQNDGWRNGSSGCISLMARRYSYVNRRFSRPGSRKSSSARL